jgi:hypothetical protein
MVGWDIYCAEKNFGRKSIINLTLGWHALNVFGHFLSQDTREQASFSRISYGQ